MTRAHGDLYKMKKSIFTNKKRVHIAQELVTQLLWANGFVVCLSCLETRTFLTGRCRMRALGQNVVLTVSPHPLQMAKLRSLFSSAENEPPVPLVGNWRPPQPIKNRVVRASFK